MARSPEDSTTWPAQWRKPRASDRPARRRAPVRLPRYRRGQIRLLRAALLTVEEQRLSASLPSGCPADWPELVRLAGLDPFVAEVKHALCAAQTRARPNASSPRPATGCGGRPVDRAQGLRPDLGALDRFDDRPLYWARLQLSSAIRQCTPAAPSQ
jgi:hypothetical protein